MDLERKIYDAMVKYALDRASIVINSELLTEGQKTVFVQMKRKNSMKKQKEQKVQENNEEDDDGITKETSLLDVFINVTVKDPTAVTRHKSGTVRKAVPEVIDKLKKILISPCIGGITVDGINRVDDNLWTVTVDEEFNLVILKSSLYRIVEDLMINRNGEIVQSEFGGSMLTSGQVSRALQLFKQLSYRLYGDLVYKSIYKKFSKKMGFASNDMYQIQNAFIPVLIDYKKVYNPVAIDQVLMNSALVRKAIEKNRVRQGDYFDMYLLSHMEVCEALHMKSFMRFTPGFLYNFMVGLAHPTYSGFPAVNKSVFVKTDNLGGKDCYTEQEFMIKQQRLKQEIEDPSTDPAARGLAKNDLEAILSGTTYTKMSSLLQYCYAERDRLATFGSTVLDNPRAKRAQDYYEYLQSARLI